MQATPAEIALWSSWLVTAESAYHDLMTGSMPVEVSVDGGGQATKFARPDADKLQAYITDLRERIRKGAFADAPCGEAIGIVF